MGGKTASGNAEGEASRRSLVGGRYVLGEAIGSGGMATVHLARQTGPLGHARVVALKRLRREYVRDPEFVAMLIDEARLTARIRHTNVVPLLDLVAEDGELVLVLDYVPGVPLSWLATAARDSRVALPVAVVVALGLDLLDGLHAIHEARDDRGNPLEIIHRDVSPQNVLVGEDGVARLLDLGVAKAARRAQTTRGGELKGKLNYMAPEQLELRQLDRRADVYSAAVVLWELCAGRRLHDHETAAEILDATASGPVALATLRPVDAELAAVEAELVRALCYSAKARASTALELAQALQHACPPAPRWEVREWVSRLGRSVLDERAELVRLLEQETQPVTAREIVAAVAQERSGNDAIDSQTGVTASVHKGNGTSSKRAVALLALVAVVVGVALLSRRPAPEPSVRSSAPASPEAPAAAMQVPVALRTADPLPPPSEAAPAAPQAGVASVAPEPKRTASQHHAGALLPTKPAPVQAPPAPSAQPASSCNPPFRIDPAGVRVYKEECL